MTARGNCDELVLAARYASAYMTADKCKITSNYGRFRAKSMRVSLEASLQKLRTTYIDLFYIHWWGFTVSVPELMHNLNDF